MERKFYQESKETSVNKWLKKSGLFFKKINYCMGVSLCESMWKCYVWMCVSVCMYIFVYEWICVLMCFWVCTCVCSLQRHIKESERKKVTKDSELWMFINEQTKSRNLILVDYEAERACIETVTLIVPSGKFIT